MATLRTRESAHSILRLGRHPLWKGHRDLELKFVDWMLRLWNTQHVGLNSLVVAFQIWRNFYSLVLLTSPLSNEASLRWAKATFKVGWLSDLAGVSRRLTSDASKLLANKEVQELLLFRLAMLVFLGTFVLVLLSMLTKLECITFPLEMSWHTQLKGLRRFSSQAVVTSGKSWP